MSRAQPELFVWLDTKESKPPQGERVLLAIRDSYNPVVGYWGCGVWDVCTDNVTACCDGVVDASFDSRDIMYYMHIGETPD